MSYLTLKKGFLKKWRKRNGQENFSWFYRRFGGSFSCRRRFTPCPHKSGLCAWISLRMVAS